MLLKPGKKHDPVMTSDSKHQAQKHNFYIITHERRFEINEKQQVKHKYDSKKNI